MTTANEHIQAIREALVFTKGYAANEGVLIGMRKEAEKALESLTALEAMMWDREGLVLVPKEPTNEMIACGYKAASEGYWSDKISSLNTGCIYRAMIAAAPKPPKE